VVSTARAALKKFGLTLRESRPILFGLDAIDLRWTLKDIDSKAHLVNQQGSLAKAD
jgi:hypothetical protein